MSSAAEPAGVTGAAGGRTIVWPIFALVIASVLVATAVFIAVTFSGPPPMPRPYALAGVARALRTGQVADAVAADPWRDSEMRPPLGPAGPPDLPGTPDRMRPPARTIDLRLATRAAPPLPRDGERADPRRQAAIAALLGVVPADVRVFAEDDRFAADSFLVGDFTIALHTGQGWRVIQSAHRPFLTRWHWVTMAAMLAAVLALSIPAFALARAISRPLRRLARAAEQARAGAALPPLPHGGSREVRELTRAVEAMHARLAGHAEARTAMLGGIAHDLGTPLARLAFWIEQLPEPAHGRASADIDEMRAMIAATLAFARDESGERPALRVDLGSLLDSLVDDMAAGGAPVAIVPGARVRVRGEPVALRRLFANLIENAVRYGDRADVAWALQSGSVVVTIADHGPGIDPAAADRLFDPFVRGEKSRNRATGGTGLGLAIVRSIATRHAGTATLENGVTGAIARVTLPLSD